MRTWREENKKTTKIKLNKMKTKCKTRIFIKSHNRFKILKSFITTLPTHRVYKYLILTLRTTTLNIKSTKK